MTDRGGTGSGVRSTLRLALSRPGMRRALIAYGLFATTEMATWIALLVWAFDRGGASAAGTIAVVQLLPAMVAAPLVAALLERLPRRQALHLGYLLQTAANVAAGVALLAGSPFWLVAAVAAVAASTMTLTRPVHHALMPELARTPEELTASNAASTAVDGIGVFLGPALAGALLVVGSAGSVFLVMAAVGLVAVLLIGPSAGDRRPRPETARASYWTDMAQGLRVALRDPAARALTTIVSAQYVVVGMLDILAVVLALDILRTGPAGPGILGAAVGIGGLVGAGTAIALLRTEHMGLGLLLAMIVAAIPVALVAGVPGLAIACALFGLSGAGLAGVDVAARTLLQRSVPPTVLARILGIQEAMLMGGTAVGAALAPLLVTMLGPRAAFLAVAGVLPLSAALVTRQIRRLDAAGPPSQDVELLRANSTFAALPPAQLEQLASALIHPAPLADGSVLFRQGDEGDRCYLVVEGAMRIERDGVLLATLGPGDIVGEIALLRDIPRTATARAQGEVQLAALERAPFMLALTGSEQAAADITARTRRRLDEQ